jgi:ABC-type Fe3+-hydroxamate transport system substrate-binding protein
MSRSTRWCWSALCLLLLLSSISCSSRTEQQASSTSTPSTSAPTTTAPVSVVAVDLGRNIDVDKLVTERVEVFKPKDTIYASIRTNGASPNAKLAVKWIYQDGQVVDQSEQMIAPEGTTEFHITKPDGLPAGNYKVEILVDGSSVQTKDFRVTAG